MPFLLGFAFVIFGFLVLALGGIWGVMPEGWEWVGGLFAIVGVIMEIPGLLQMTIGRAKLIAEFEKIVEREKRSLALFMKNPQLGDASIGKKSIWRRIGVKRESVESLIVSFQIREVGSGKVVIPIMQARIYSDADSSEEGSWRIRVPPTLSYETSVMVAMWNESKRVAVVPGDRLKGEVELPKGAYRIEVIFVVDGEPQKRFREFIVGDSADELSWVRQVGGKGDFKN
ncbi:MAG TPA: hypothetical protein VMV76_07965 [Dehalococcoidia bacterium]|nr:hypothetical protein [Dehalococcoidia bacterium]